MADTDNTQQYGGGRGRGRQRQQPRDEIVDVKYAVGKKVDTEREIVVQARANRGYQAKQGATITIYVDGKRTARGVADQNGRVEIPLRLAPREQPYRMQAQIEGTSTVSEEYLLTIEDTAESRDSQGLYDIDVEATENPNNPGEWTVVLAVHKVGEQKWSGGARAPKEVHLTDGLVYIEGTPATSHRYRILPIKKDGTVEAFSYGLGPGVWRKLKFTLPGYRLRQDVEVELNGPMKVWQRRVPLNPRPAPGTSVASVLRWIKYWLRGVR